MYLYPPSYNCCYREGDDGDDDDDARSRNLRDAFVCVKDLRVSLMSCSNLRTILLNILFLLRLLSKVS
ncbi:hypothetical protein CSUI_006826 [Cystoisospora suis]|uniref:Uncharacterized protein n=1 Tax=Cystoisospora suis TaxID=483139 RepID=A0A2C6KSR2_9APIC|nr:hypothetical protein CSUI_006826 [Cystoisospora suis]